MMLWNILDPCDPNPCLNGGTCMADDDNNAVCRCPPEFEGDRCEIPGKLN